MKKARSISRVLVALALASALAGCAGGGSSGGDGTALTIARVKDAVTLDPSHATDGMSLNVTTEIMEGLVAFKPGSFDVVPAIAQSWTTSPDGKVWTFTLRPEQKFSDGTALDAQAVKFNFDRWRLTSDPTHGNYPYSYYHDVFGGFPGIITNVEAPSPTTVRFTLARPLGPFLRDLAMPSFAIGSPTAIKADVKAFELKPVGSGPYTVAEWVKNDHITLTANPSWKPAPVYQTVIIRDIPDQATSVLSLQKGDIDGLTDPRPDDAKTLAKQSGVHVYLQPSNNLAYLAMNMDKKPFGDLRVRQAIAYAIDLPAIVRALYGPGTSVANTWVPPGMIGSSAGTKAYPHDIAKAKSLLAAAGFPNGFKTELYYPTTPRPYMPEPQRLAETLQADLRAAGIDVTLQPFEFGVFLAKVQNGEHPMCLIGWTGDNGDPDNFMYTLLDQDSAKVPSAQNYSFWRDPAFHALMLAGQRETNEAQRTATYDKANVLVHDQVPAVPLVHTEVPFAMKESVGGVIPRPDNVLNFELMHPAGKSS